MDITPSQPAPSPSPKGKRKEAASAAPKNSNKKPRNKPTESPPAIAEPLPAKSSDAAPDDTACVEAVEELLMENMEGMIATAAYYLAERRNFAPGHELQDWLEAEQQLRK